MNSTAKLGAFMIMALVVLGFFIIRIERLSLGGAASRQSVKAEFPSVAGLNEKAPVRVAGVKVGIVEKIELARDRALVTLDLEKGLALHQGARAAVRAQGLLGEQYVEIVPGPTSAPPLPDGTVLSGTTPSGMDTLLDTANTVGTDIKAVTASMRETLGGPEGQRRLQDIVDNIRELTENIKAITADNRTQIQATIANFREFSETLKTELPKLADKLNSLASGLDQAVAENRGNLSGTMENVREISERLKVSADNLNQITGKIARGEGTVGKLINDDTTVNNLNSTLKSVEGGVASLKDTLGRPQRWKLDVDMRSEMLPKIDDSRSSFNADLHTTDRRFFRVGLVKAPRGREVITDETITTSIDGGPETTFHEKTTKYNNDFTYNVQAAYRYGPTTVRAGLFESVGGVGVDHALLDDKLNLTLEAYDFGKQGARPRPHLRFETRYFVTPYIYAYAGYDDPLWSIRRSALVGAGIRWTDEDLKYLIGSAASLAK